MSSKATQAFIRLLVLVPETVSADLGNPSPNMTHSFDAPSTNGGGDTLAQGTSASQVDVVYSKDYPLAAAAQTVDLLGSVTSALDGHALSFVKVVGIFIWNKATTTAYELLVGAGSNPFTGWMTGTTPQIKVGPGGFLAWYSPIDGKAPVAGTGDLVQLDPGANTFTVRVLVIGRSA